MNENKIFGDYSLANEKKTDPEIDQRIDDILRQLYPDMKPYYGVEYFKDPDFYNSLPEEIRNSDERLKEYIYNSENFSSIISAERSKRWKDDVTSLFGEEVILDESVHHDGRVRRAEEGYKINVEYLKTIGIDPEKVLFFRVTQPTETPKPEYYWTSDYFETRQGLTAEIPHEQRLLSIILVSDLATINENEGLIQDINDDQGLAVRQIGSGSFDQTRALARIQLKEK
jgi:hypothetical protein